MDRETYHIPTKDAYDRWAPTYDNDGNILQSLDSMGLSETLLPRSISSLEFGSPNKPYTAETDSQSQPLRVIDLGCGTGRATLRLLDAIQKIPLNMHSSSELVFPGGRAGNLHILGLDSSERMLEVARSRVPANLNLPVTFGLSTEPGSTQSFTSLQTRTTFQVYDIQNHSEPDLLPDMIHADAIICALVVEHLPSLPAFFSHLISAKLLKKGGVLVLSNMHPDMAAGALPVPNSNSSDAIEARPLDRHNTTGAGFIDSISGNKIRVSNSFAHTIPELLDAARANGFELLGDGKVEEMRVEDWMLDKGFVDRERGRKWAKGGVLCWFGAVFQLDPDRNG